MIRRGDAKAGIDGFQVARLDAYDVMAAHAADSNLGLWRACTLG